MDWASFLVGAVVAAPVAGVLILLRARRATLRARRLAASARTREHLVELAKLTGGLAHEIKNPLSTIQLNLKLLSEDFADSADDRCRRNHARLERVWGEVQRVHDILDDFLKYAGSPELHRRQADLREVVQELIDFFRPQAESSRVVLRCSLPDAPVTCAIDVALIKQAILNLMINATQAMGAGGELLLRLGRDGDRAVLEVIDTGPGIEPEAGRRMFEAYYSTRVGGSGLGLPTTRRIVRQHDGDIRVDSEVGKGTRFIVALPLGGLLSEKPSPHRAI